jgi:hypothetical protein
MASIIKKLLKVDTIKYTMTTVSGLAGKYVTCWVFVTFFHRVNFARHRRQHSGKQIKVVFSLAVIIVVVVVFLVFIQ